VTKPCGSSTKHTLRNRDPVLTQPLRGRAPPLRGPVPPLRSLPHLSGEVGAAQGGAVEADPKGVAGVEGVLLSRGKQALQRALQADQSHIHIRKSIAEKGFLAFSSINIELFSILTLSLSSHTTLALNGQVAISATA